jgi:ParB family chromosome partitioning protein
MPRKTGLGRGLDALIPSMEFLPEGQEFQAGVNQVAIEQILPNPRQPRINFDAQELGELAASIRQHGVIQPLIVTRGVQGDQYILVAGERRLLAARQAGLDRVPVLVREASEQQRLDPLEAAEAYRQLVDDFHLSHEEIADRVGKSRVTVTNTLRLLKLPEAIKRALIDKRISEGHARALLALPTPQAQLAVLRTILAHDLNVRQAEELVRKMSGEKQPAKPRSQQAPEISDLQSRLEASLGTRVSLKPRGEGGVVSIHYYSNEELDALVSRLLKD